LADSLGMQHAVDQVNNALAQIELYESGDVLVHTIEIDRQSRAREFQEEEFRETRASLTGSVRAFIVAGRSVLGAPTLSEELARLPADSPLRPGS
jgi:hypothetical protein